jgi:hypothetical protein
VAVRREVGSVTPLVVGAVLIAGLVVTATVAASAAFLAQRDLAGFCDGAAVATAAGATTTDENGDPAVDPARVDAALRDYATTAHDGDRTTTTATTDGSTVAVTCARRTRIPFGAVLGAPDGLDRTVVARARPVAR